MMTDYFFAFEFPFAIRAGGRLSRAGYLIMLALCSSALCSSALCSSAVWAQEQPSTPAQKEQVRDTATNALGKRAEEDLSRLRPDAPNPISPGELEASIARGVKHLTDSQNKNGSWGGPQWTGGVDNDPVPGSFRSFDIAVTAMCLEALIDVTPSDEITAANEKAYQFLISKTNKIQRAGPVSYTHLTLPTIYSV